MKSSDWLSPQKHQNQPMKTKMGQELTKQAEEEKKTDPNQSIKSSFSFVRRIYHSVTAESDYEHLIESKYKIFPYDKVKVCNSDDDTIYMVRSVNNHGILLDGVDIRYVETDLESIPDENSRIRADICTLYRRYCSSCALEKEPPHYEIRKRVIMLMKLRNPSVLVDRIALDLSDIKVPEIHVSAIAKALMYDRLVSKLLLANTKLNDTSLRYLTSTLRNNHTIKELDISRNLFRGKGLSELLLCIEQTGLKTLNISDCGIEAETLSEFLQALKRNGRCGDLRSVDIRRNGLAGDTLLTIQNILKARLLQEVKVGTLEDIIASTEEWETFNAELVIEMVDVVNRMNETNKLSDPDSEVLLDKDGMELDEDGRKQVLEEIHVVDGASDEANLDERQSLLFAQCIDAFPMLSPALVKYVILREWDGSCEDDIVDLLLNPSEVAQAVAATATDVAIPAETAPPVRKVPVILIEDDDPEDPQKSPPVATNADLYFTDPSKEKEMLENERLLKKMLEAERKEREEKLEQREYPCDICLESYRLDSMYFMDNCSHRFCNGCVKRYVAERISMGDTMIKCPHYECKETLTRDEVTMIMQLNPSTMDSGDGEPQDAVMNMEEGKIIQKYDRLLLKHALEGMEDIRFCPRPGCENAMVGSASNPMIVCSNPDCCYTFCFKCKREWHADMTCEQYQEWLEDNEQSDDKFNEWIQAHAKVCPNCGAYIEKNGGCNHMKCKKCRHEFCWLCGEPYQRGKHFKTSSCPLFS